MMEYIVGDIKDQGKEATLHVLCIFWICPAVEGIVERGSLGTLDSLGKPDAHNSFPGEVRNEAELAVFVFLSPQFRAGAEAPSNVGAAPGLDAFAVLERPRHEILELSVSPHRKTNRGKVAAHA